MFIGITLLVLVFVTVSGLDKNMVVEQTRKLKSGEKIKGKIIIKCLSKGLSHHVLPEQLQRISALIIQVCGSLLEG